MNVETASTVNRGRKTCRGCSLSELFEALDLGFSPLANNVIAAESLEAPEPWYPLILRVCGNCGLGQLGEFAGETEIFRDYPYLSSTSTTWLEANESFAEEVIDLLSISPKDLVVELASNDGYLLKFFRNRGVPVLGIEPALNVATLAALEGIATSPEFFSKKLANTLSDRGVSPKLIVAKNVLAHVPDIRDFIAGISEISTKDTLIVIEAPSILNILQHMQFDTVYHEHFSYLSASFFKNVLGEFDLKLIGAEKVSTHGGSMRLYVSLVSSSIQLPHKNQSVLNEILVDEESSGFMDPDSWKGLGERVGVALENFRSWVSSRKGRIIGFGAAAKAVTLLSSAQVPRHSISLCVDNSQAKIGKFIPGSHIEIVSEADYFENRLKPDDVFLVFPWNLEKEISERIKLRSPGASVFVALPSMREV